jgi:hypothetical protein
MNAERKDSRHPASDDSITSGPDCSLVTRHAASGCKAASAIRIHAKAFSRPPGILTVQAILTGGYPFAEVTPFSGSLMG